MSPNIILFIILLTILLTLIITSFYLALKPQSAAEKAEAARRKKLDVDEYDEEDDFIQSNAI